MVQVFLEEGLCIYVFSADFREIVQWLAQIQIASVLGQINLIFAELIVFTKVSVANVKTEYIFGLFSTF